MNDHPPRPPGAGATHSHGVAVRLAARRRRVWAIRARVAGLSVAGLIAASGVVVVQMVTGNDPALAKTHADPEARAAASATQTHRTRRRSPSSSRRAASTPTTVTTSAS